MSLEFDHIPANLYHKLLYSKESDCSKRWKANVQVTWNHIVYFFKHFKIETPKSLAEHLITHLRQANQSSSSYQAGMCNLIRQTFTRVYQHVQDPQLQKRFDDELHEYQKFGSRASSEQTPALSTSQAAPSLSDLTWPSNEKELYLDKDASNWNLDQIEGLLNKYPIQTIIFPLFTASPGNFVLQFKRILDLIQKQPRQINLHFSVRHGALSFLKDLAYLYPSSLVELYRHADKTTQERILTKFFNTASKACVITKVTAASIIFSAIQAHDLPEAVKIVFKNCDALDRFEILKRLIPLVCEENDFKNNLEKIGIIIDSQGTDSADLLNKVVECLSDCVSDDPPPIARAELRCFTFYRAFEKLTTDSDKIDYLTKQLHSSVFGSPSDNFRDENLTLATMLAETCQLKHCPVILQALLNNRYDNKTIVLGNFITTILKKRPDLMSNAFSAKYGCPLDQNVIDHVLNIHKIHEDLQSANPPSQSIQVTAPKQTLKDFFENFDLVPTEQEKVQLLLECLENLSSPAEILGQQCEEKHVRVILLALMPKLSAVADFIGVILRERPTLIGKTFKEYFVFNDLTIVSFANLLRDIDEEQKLRAIVQEIPDGAPMVPKEVLLHLLGRKGMVKSPLSQDIIHKVLLEAAPIKTKAIYLALIGQPSAMGMLLRDQFFNEFQACSSQQEAKSCLIKLIPDIDIPFFAYVAQACSLNHLPVIFDVLEELTHQDKRSTILDQFVINITKFNKDPLTISDALKRRIELETKLTFRSGRHATLLSSILIPVLPQLQLQALMDLKSAIPNFTDAAELPTRAELINKIQERIDALSPQKVDWPLDFTVDKTVLLLPQDFAKWDANLIDAILKRHPINTVAFPPHSAAIDLSRVAFSNTLTKLFDCLCKSPINIHISSQTDVAYLFGLAATQTAQFYELADQATKEKIIEGCMSSLEGKQIENKLLNSLPFKALDRFVRAIFKKYSGQTTVHNLLVSLCQNPHDYADNLKRVGVVFHCLGLTQDAVLDELVKSLVKNHHDGIALELRCYKFYRKLDDTYLPLILTSSSPQERLMIATILAESCEDKHCPAIIKALTKSGAQEMICYLTTVLRKNPQAVSPAFQAYFDSYQSGTFDALLKNIHRRDDLAPLEFLLPPHLQDELAGKIRERRIELDKINANRGF